MGHCTAFNAIRAGVVPRRNLILQFAFHSVEPKIDVFRAASLSNLCANRLPDTSKIKPDDRWTNKSSWLAFNGAAALASSDSPLISRAP